MRPLVCVKCDALGASEQRCGCAASRPMQNELFVLLLVKKIDLLFARGSVTARTLPKHCRTTAVERNDARWTCLAPDWSTAAVLGLGCSVGDPCLGSVSAVVCACLRSWKNKKNNVDALICRRSYRGLRNCRRGRRVRCIARRGGQGSARVRVFLRSTHTRASDPHVAILARR